MKLFKKLAGAAPGGGPGRRDSRRSMTLLEGGAHERERRGL